MKINTNNIKTDRNQSEFNYSGKYEFSSVIKNTIIKLIILK